jgi:predicted Zn finger-like uncharacterized protein
MYLMAPKLVSTVTVGAFVTTGNGATSAASAARAREGMTFATTAATDAANVERSRERRECLSVGMAGDCSRKGRRKVSTETRPAKIPPDASGPTFVQQNLQANQFNIFVNWPRVQGQTPPMSAMMLVCPHCRRKEVNKTDFAGDGFKVRCVHCHTDFTTRLVQVTSESHERLPAGTIYSVRAVEPWVGNANALLQFGGAGYQDFELRPGDFGVFTYLAGLVRVVQNVTIQKDWFVPLPVFGRPELPKASG